MNHGSPLMRWKEIVHPLFWPVFFWNLRRFLVFMRELVAETGGNGLIHYEVTWWGGIRVWKSFRPDGAKWDDGLGVCAGRVHSATLDVCNPHLSSSPLSLALTDVHFGVMTPSAGHACMSISAQDAVCAAFNAGSFAEPAHLNSS